MHLSDHRVGFLGGNGIVGASLGIAMGAALAATLQRVDRVAVGFFGDGGINTGRTWETLNMAGVWNLKLIAICENNLYAVETPLSRVMAGDSVAERARGFGLRSLRVDGQDVRAIHAAVRGARVRAIAGEGPTFIEAQTYRYHGHNIGEVITYRTDEEVQSWRDSRDPIEHLRGQLIALGALDEDGWTALHEEVLAVVADAVAFADASPWPDLETATLSATVSDEEVR
jgi:TPP-dependent pyruvate/acetoin dehydrogenase alpha subunit